MEIHTIIATFSIKILLLLISSYSAIIIFQFVMDYTHILNFQSILHVVTLTEIYKFF